MLRAYPHHGFTELTQIDTFYNGLNENDQDSLNAAAGGNLLRKTTRESLHIIENKSKNQSSTSGTLPSNTISNPKGEMKAITTRSGIAYEGPSIPTPEKVVEQETEETTDKEQSNFHGSTAHIQPPVTLTLEPDVPKTLPKTNIPYPSRLNDQKLREKATNQMENRVKETEGVRKLQSSRLGRQDSRTSLFQEEENDTGHVRASSSSGLAAGSSVNIYKACLVAKGYAQEYAMDYEETFAHVAKITMVRTLIAVASSRKWKIFQLDVKNAFLNGNLNEEVFMKPPPDVSYKSREVCKLRKALYGPK
nr:integrase, catalytic core [Tanacetum cinerariifolium]